MIETFFQIETSNIIWVGLNALISTIIVLRLLSYRRNGAHFRKVGGWVAIALVVGYAYFPLEMLCGENVSLDDGQILINLVVMMAVLKTKGNVMSLFRVG